MRRIGILLGALVVVLAGVVPTAASEQAYSVEFAIESGTSGSGGFTISGAAVGNETSASGVVTYDRPSGGPLPPATLPIDVTCMVVVPSVNTTLDTDFNVVAVGPLTGVVDPGGLYDEYEWAALGHLPDNTRSFGASRPIFVQLYKGAEHGPPSCDLADLFWWTTPPGRWYSAGYFTGGYITVEMVDLDADGDGVPDEEDLCLGTTLGDPPERLKKNRFATNGDGLFLDVNESPSGFTIVDTFGCDEDQIIEWMDLGRGHVKFGITRSVLQKFTSG